MTTKEMKIKALAKKTFNYMMKGFSKSYALALAGADAGIVLEVSKEVDEKLKKWRGEE